MQHIFPDNCLSKAMDKFIKEKLLANNIQVDPKVEELSRKLQDPNVHESTATMTSMISIMFVALQLPEVLGGPLQLFSICYQFLITGVPLIEVLNELKYFEMVKKAYNKSLGKVVNILYKVVKKCCSKKIPKRRFRKSHWMPRNLPPQR